MVRAQIGWALRGKPAGSHDEYTILASGGAALDARDAEAILSGFSPGTPPAGRGNPGSLPWVVLSEFRDDRQHYLGLTVQDWSHEADAAGRPISSSRYFYVPYQVMADHRISYRGLYQALRAVDLPRDGEALDAELTGTPELAQVAAVERVGFERAAAAAALLLEGPVTVTRAEDLTLEGKLDFFDAVAALLPYGWRTRFSASTWHNDGSRHLRLAFAGQCRPGSAELDWRTPKRPAEAVAGAYWDQLDELIRRRDRPLTALVSYMASRTKPLAGAAPADAVIDLEELDKPYTVLLKARQEGVGLDELRRLFASGRFRELPDPRDRMYLFDLMIRGAEVEDLPLVESLWKEAGGLPQPLAWAARRRVWRQGLTAEEGHYLRLAERLGFADHFLSELVRGPGPDEKPGGEAAVAELVLTRAAEGHTQTFQAVAQSNLVLCRLFHRLAADPRADLNGWFRRLEPFVSKVFLQPFSSVLDGQGRPVDSSALAMLADHGRDSLPTLLLAAEARGRLNLVLMEFASLLIRDTRFNPEFWATRLAGLTPADPRHKGVLDALRAWLGRPPRHLADAGHGDWAAGYREGFASVLRMPGAESGLERALTGLADHLGTSAWYRDPRQVEAVLALATEYQEAQDLTQAVLAARAKAPELLDDEGYDAWRQRAFELRPGLAHEEAGIVLAALPADAVPETVARLCAEMLHGGVQTGQVVAYLLRSDWQLTGERATRLIIGTRRSLIARRVSESEAGRFSLILTRTLMAQRPSLADPLRNQAARRAYAEMRYYTELLNNVAADVQDDKSFHLDELTRQQLTDLTGMLKGLIEASKPRKRRLL